LPLYFQFGKTAHFHISPEKGMLHPLQTRDVLVSFTPDSLGSYTKYINLQVFGIIKELLGMPTRRKKQILSSSTNGEAAGRETARMVFEEEEDLTKILIREIPITLSGMTQGYVDCTVDGTIAAGVSRRATHGGIDKIPEDFSPKFNFDIANAGNSTNSNKSRIPGVVGGAAHNALAAQYTSSEGGVNRPFQRKTGWLDEEHANKFSGEFSVKHNSADSKYTWNTDEVRTRLDHRNFYATYLGRVRKERITKAQEDLFDFAVNFPDEAKSKVIPNSVMHHGLKDQLIMHPLDPVNMGLGFATGLKDPDPGLPPRGKYMNEDEYNWSCVSIGSSIE
jgi:hypothetical protein